MVVLIALTSVVVAGLFIYLTVALFRAEDL
jgi:K+-transporting ATPase KdpF subunit